MIVIGICDAEPTARIRLLEYIERYKSETNCNIQVLSYNSGEKLLKNYMLEMDMIFLEIPFRKLNGIQIAKKIRFIDKNVKIVFLTTLFNHVFEGYEVGASNYLIKPLSYNSFLNEVNKILIEKNTLETYSFIEKNADGIFKIYIKTIKFIETYNRNTLIHTEKEQIISYKQMKEHEAILPNELFIRCHTSYLINLYHFSKMVGNDIILITGERIPVSRKRKNTVSEKILEYYEGGRFH